MTTMTTTMTMMMTTTTTTTGGLLWPLLFIVILFMFVVLLVCFIRYIIANKPIDSVIPCASCELCTEMQTFSASLNLSVSTTSPLVSQETVDGAPSAQYAYDSSDIV
uniref:Uncharacterized protein n=1 Tax=Plectus sambesii TaxID=2011161 RepID=A0A914X7G7_9BILA